MQRVASRLWLLPGRSRRWRSAASRRLGASRRARMASSAAHPSFSRSCSGHSGDGGCASSTAWSGFRGLCSMAAVRWRPAMNMHGRHPPSAFSAAAAGMLRAGEEQRPQVRRTRRKVQRISLAGRAVAGAGRARKSRDGGRFGKRGEQKLARLECRTGVNRLAKSLRVRVCPAQLGAARSRLWLRHASPPFLRLPAHARGSGVWRSNTSLSTLAGAPAKSASWIGYRWSSFDTLVPGGLVFSRTGGIFFQRTI